MGVTKQSASGISLESGTTEGDSPVRESRLPPEGYLSRSGHVESRLNLRGPSHKTKYSLTTDSELSRATKRWEEPLLGEESEPETMCLQAVGALWSARTMRDGVPFA